MLTIFTPDPSCGRDFAALHLPSAKPDPQAIGRGQCGAGAGADVSAGAAGERVHACLPVHTTVERRGLGSCVSVTGWVRGGGWASLHLRTEIDRKKERNTTGRKKVSQNERMEGRKEGRT